MMDQSVVVGPRCGLAEERFERGEQALDGFRSGL